MRRAVSDDWAELREVRLAALRDAPYAFASTYAGSVGYDEAHWRTRIAASAPFLAWSEQAAGGLADPAALAGTADPAYGRPIGLAIGIADEEEPADERHLISMWVDPAARGTGVAAALVDAVRGWAAAEGAVALNLWVVDGNEPAARFYTRLGFTDTGVRQLYPRDPSVTERRLQLRW